MWVEAQLNKMPIHDVITGAIGLAIGLIIANLLGAAFSSSDCWKLCSGYL